MKEIKVLIVDDSAVSREILTQVLNDDSQIVVIGEAKNGIEAIEFMKEKEPDLILMDLHMPMMDGLETTKKIMAIRPTPIVMISAFPYKDGKSIVFDALEAGALDVLEKPAAPWLKMPTIKNRLINQLKILAEVKVGKSTAARDTQTGSCVETREFKNDILKVVGIVASTGGPQAVKAVLKCLPKDIHASIVIAQHITEGFTAGLAEWLDQGVQVSVRVAENNEHLAAGTVYVAPDRHHLEISSAHRIKVTPADDASDAYVPSGNMMLTSLAKSYGSAAIGIVLTGMGNDGSSGLKAMKTAGAITVAQDEATSIVFGMPKAAIENDAASCVLSLDEIGSFIVENIEVAVSK